jgi:uncharacterized membrane protein (DUF2068 family)
VQAPPAVVVVVLVGLVLEVVGVDVAPVELTVGGVEPAGELVRTLLLDPQAEITTAISMTGRSLDRARITASFAGRCSESSPDRYGSEMDRPPGTPPHPPRRRPRRQVDWELVTCGFRGHALLGTDAAEIRPEDSLVAREGPGLRWHRCLRCDSWVALPPPAAPTRQHPSSRDEIQLPLRGRALRDVVVLRVIALDRILHFIVLSLLGVAVLLIAANQRTVRADFYRIVTDLQGGVGGGPVQNSGHGILHELEKLFSLRNGKLRLVGGVLIAYGALEGIEAIGLWFAKRWAEYLTFIATSILLVPEVYELTHRVSALKVIGFIVNIVVVVYLLFAKRLFGLRGGGAADEAARKEAMSWEALERTTPSYEDWSAATGRGMV